MNFTILGNRLMTIMQLHISEWLYNMLIIIYIVGIVGSIFVIVSENRNASKSLAWILALIFIPVLGFLLYLLFGQSMRNASLLSQKNREKLQACNTPPLVDIDTLPISDSGKQLVLMCRRLGTARYYVGNDVRMYVKGREKFDDLLHDISQAQKFIHIQYFIFRDDSLGREVRDALIAAVQRGVEVRLLYDDMGCFAPFSTFFKDMRAKGVMAYPFMKVLQIRPSYRLNFRNHRKIVVIDGVVGYIGGMNVADRYVNGDEDMSWRDTHMRVEGAAVHGLQTSFAIDWGYERNEMLTGDKYFPNVSRAGEMDVQIIFSGPFGGWDSIAMMCEKLLSMSQRYIYIQTPYFLPTDSLVNALQVAALSGVDVRIMIPNRTDWAVMRYGSFSYISQMLAAGIKVYLYMPGMLHAKTIVADDELSSVGSANFDFRSFEHNFETNAIIYNKEMAERVKSDFYNDMKHCVLIEDLEQWRKRPFLQKVYESIVRLVSPVL
ncbi:MAG: cardiolipin synthase [Bacteroidaceae bacterium]|nr:cardiolipin synthase [Bacteroidaceae bacterium]